MNIEIIDDRDGGNLVDSLREKADLVYSTDKIILHDIQYAGKTPLEKYQDVFEYIETKNKDSKFLIDAQDNKQCLGLIITRLDNIACK